MLTTTFHRSVSAPSRGGVRIGPDGATLPDFP